MACLQNILKIEREIETDASPLIEMTYQANRNKAFEWIGLINHSGQIGGSFQEPVSIQNIKIRFKPLYPLKEIRLMRYGKAINFQIVNGWVELMLPHLNDFEMILCLYK
jgi:hypothetical protein